MCGIVARFNRMSTQNLALANYYHGRCVSYVVYPVYLTIILNLALSIAKLYGTDSIVLLVLVERAVAGAAV